MSVVAIARAVPVHRYSAATGVVGTILRLIFDGKQAAFDFKDELIVAWPTIRKLITLSVVTYLLLGALKRYVNNALYGSTDVAVVRITEQPAGMLQVSCGKSGGGDCDGAHKVSDKVGRCDVGTSTEEEDLPQLEEPEQEVAQHHQFTAVHATASLPLDATQAPHAPAPCGYSSPPLSTVVVAARHLEAAARTPKSSERRGRTPGGPDDFEEMVRNFSSSSFTAARAS